MIRKFYVFLHLLQVRVQLLQEYLNHLSLFHVWVTGLFSSRFKFAGRHNYYISIKRHQNISPRLMSLALVKHLTVKKICVPFACCSMLLSTDWLQNKCSTPSGQTGIYQSRRRVTGNETSLIFNMEVEDDFGNTSTKVDALTADVTRYLDITVSRQLTFVSVKRHRGQDGLLMLLNRKFH